VAIDQPPDAETEERPDERRDQIDLCVSDPANTQIEQ
jgi:hypothetical protein